MSDQTMTLPPMQPYPATIAGIRIGVPERRFYSYQQALMVALAQWLNETDLSAEAVQDEIAALQSRVRQAHQLHAMARAESGPKHISEILEQILPGGMPQ